METPVLIPSGADTLSGVLYRPAGAAVCGVTLCNPLFEERKSAHRVMVDLARALAAAGCAVLRFDYRGCGDSSGDFAAFGCADWKSDIAVAAAFLLRETRAPRSGLLGLRLGAALALEVAGETDGLDFVVLWEPILNGRRYLDQELRRKLIKEMVTFGQSRVTRATLIKDLEDGKAIDLDGYALAPPLFAGINAIGGKAVLRCRPRRALFVGVGAEGTASRDMAAAREALTADGVPTDLVMAAEDPFWNLVGMVECPALVAVTREWVESRIAEPVAGGCSPASPSEAQALSPAAASERPLAFRVGSDLLHGVLHEPAGPAVGPAVVFLHGWAGSRIGPHRMFVHLARRLAGRGCPCFRFDFRGRGDSEGATAQASIRGMIDDAVGAIDAVAAQCPGRPIVLLGICSGGKVAIGVAAADPRVSGLALWSAEPMGPMRDTASKGRKSAHALRAYARKLFRLETWLKLVMFRVNVRMVRKAVTAEESASRREIDDETRWLRQWRAYRGRVLFIYGTNDPETTAARTGYVSLCRDAGIAHAYHEIQGANHSFYSLAWEREVLELTEAWVCREYGVK